VARRDALVAVVLVAFAALVAWRAWRIPLGSLALPGPGLLPVAAAVLLGLLGLALLVEASTRRLAGPRPGGDAQARAALLVMAALVGYALILERAGYVLATVPLLAFHLRLYRQRWPVVMGLAVGATLASWWLFAAWLDVPLPRGTLWR
jgi:putative tricarboxylic transport membrane protein